MRLRVRRSKMLARRSECLVLATQAAPGVSGDAVFAASLERLSERYFRALALGTRE